MPSPGVSQVDLPVIDISSFPHDFDVQLAGDHPVLAKLRDACKEWGFFLLVSHGIQADLLETAEELARDILSLPTEVKDRASATGNAFDTYFRHKIFEAFRVPDSTNPASFEKLCEMIWPQGNPIFRETMTTYALSLSNLEKKITKMILASLGLNADAFYDSHFEKCSAILRINGYPSDNIDIRQEALVHHTDLNCLTILQQDDAGGLQIRSEGGEWLNVKPLPHSFVVNLGDSFKAWSNGRYRSAEHRVVYNGWRYRVSIGIFISFTDETEIWAPEELVDDKNPRRYKPFLYSHFKKERLIDRGNIDQATVLETIAGI